MSEKDGARPAFIDGYPTFDDADPRHGGYGHICSEECEVWKQPPDDGRKVLPPPDGSALPCPCHRCAELNRVCHSTLPSHVDPPPDDAEEAAKRMLYGLSELGPDVSHADVEAFAAQALRAYRQVGVERGQPEQDLVAIAEQQIATIKREAEVAVLKEAARRIATTDPGPIYEKPVGALVMNTIEACEKRIRDLIAEKEGQKCRG